MELANANLEILAIENALLNPNFNSHITDYSAQVSNETTKLNILAIPENEQGKVQISGNDNITEGNNIITITVTAPNGITKRNYQVNVYKRNNQEEEKYQEEQNEKAEKLEQAYEVEKISATNDEEDVSEKAEEEKQQEENKSYVLIVAVIIIVLIIAVVIGVIYYKKKNIKRK